MGTECPQCQSAETAPLYIPSPVVVYRGCRACGCVFTIDLERPWAPPFIVTRSDPSERKGNGGGN